MIRSIKERLKAKETKWGTILKNWVGKLFLLISAVGALTEYFAIMPPDLIPGWLRLTVLIAGAIAFVVGKLTVKKDVDVSLEQSHGKDKVVVTKKP